MNNLNISLQVDDLFDDSTLDDELDLDDNELDLDDDELDLDGDELEEDSNIFQVGDDEED